MKCACLCPRRTGHEFFSPSSLSHPLLSLPLPICYASYTFLVIPVSPLHPNANQEAPHLIATSYKNIFYVSLNSFKMVSALWVQFGELQPPYHKMAESAINLTINKITYKRKTHSSISFRLRSTPKNP